MEKDKQENNRGIKRLEELRTLKGLSQKKLAQELGITQQSICKYENGQGEPTIHALIGIAEYFNVSVDYLIGKSNKKGIETDAKISEEEYKVLSAYKKLDKNGREALLEMAETLSRYKFSKRS